MLKELKAGFLMMIVMTVITGLVYPGVITAIAQLAFSDQARVDQFGDPLAYGRAAKPGSAGELRTGVRLTRAYEHQDPDQVVDLVQVGESHRRCLRHVTPQ